MHQHLHKDMRSNKQFHYGAKLLTLLLVTVLLVSSLPKMPLVHAAASYHVTFSTHNFGLQFLHAAADDLSNPQHATFSLTNGAALWYSIEVQSRPSGLQPVAADPLNDLVSSAFAENGLLPPSGIVPINVDGTFFEKVSLATSFSDSNQQIQITLNPFNTPAVTFDVLNLLLQLLGETSTNVQVGLLAPNHLQQIYAEIKTAGDLVHLINDFVSLLHGAAQHTAGVFGAANAFVNDLLKLFTNKNELTVLGKILVSVVGAAIPGIGEALTSFATGLSTFLVTATLVKFLADLALSLGSYLFQQDTFPTVTLQTVSSQAAVPAPSLDQLTVYLSSQDGIIYALNASNGTQRWKYQTNKGFLRPEVFDGVVYFIIDEDINTNPNATSTMYELDARNGTLLRQFHLPYFVIEGGSYIPDFTVVQGVIYLSAPEMVFALDANNGSQLWQYQCFCRGVSVPVVVNSVVYFGVEVGSIYALNSHNGAPLWSYKLPADEVAPGSIMGSDPAPVVVNNTVYEVSPITDNVYAINANNGTLRWHIHLNNQQTGVLYGANGVIYVNTYTYGSDSNIIPYAYALRADDGTQLWHQANASIRFVDGVMLYASDNANANNLEALRASDGSILWHTQLVLRSVLTGGYGIVYASTDSVLYAFHGNDGSILWQVPIPTYYIVGPK